MAKNDPPQYVFSMLKNSKSFFEVIVFKNYQIYIGDTSIVNAMNFAISMHHMMEWHWHTLNPGKSTDANSNEWNKFQFDMERSCPHLKNIRDICNAAKHCGPSRQPFNLQRVWDSKGQGGSGGYGVATAMPAYGSAREEIHLITDDKGVWFRDVAAAAFNHWNNVIQTIQIKSENNT